MNQLKFDNGSKKKVRGLRRRKKNLINTFNEMTAQLLNLSHYGLGYWHLHLPFDQGYIDTIKAPNKLRREIMQILINRVSYLKNLKTPSQDQYRIYTVVFFYYDENNCIGRIKIRSNWNGYALIEDNAVVKKYRKKGVGTALLNKAIEWAKENNFSGLVLETQDINVSACHFYAKNHFVIGAIDTMLYSNFPTANEIAIFWYYKF